MHEDANVHCEGIHECHEDDKGINEESIVRQHQHVVIALTVHIRQ